MKDSLTYYVDAARAWIVVDYLLIGSFERVFSPSP